MTIFMDHTVMVLCYDIYYHGCNYDQNDINICFDEKVLTGLWAIDMGMICNNGHSDTENWK